jgi:hypothetical protein
MSSQYNKRLRRLETAEQAVHRSPRITRALLLTYGTAEEVADWETAGSPEVSSRAVEAAIDTVYTGGAGDVQV